MALAALTILCSSFLLFQVQPMVGKLILPWFGGAASVWTTCMLFFQALLLVGYWYADISVSKLTGSRRLWTHGLLVGGSVWLLLSRYGMSWRPNEGSDPVTFIVLFLGATIGLPYLALSATAPLVQGVLGKSSSSLKVYRLYALSNFSSLVALLSYPSILERYLPLSLQLKYWTYGFFVYALLSCLFLFRQKQIGTLPHDPDDPKNIEPTSIDALRWFFYAAVGCVVLLGSTNHICQNIASIPFLWILPLSLYLLTYILAFAQTATYSRRLFIPLFVLSAISLIWLEQGGTPRLAYLLLTSSLLTFSGCMICHGEIAAHKPAPAFLTRFYFIMSFGSIFGSLFVVLLAPIFFRFYSEYMLSLLLCGIIGLCALVERSSQEKLRRLTVPILAGGSLLALLITFAIDRLEKTIASRRNFYGVLYVKEKNPEVPKFHFYRMFHGEVVHGFQFQQEDRRSTPTSYYSENSGIGLILKNYRPNKTIRLAAVGLGAGTVATYGQNGDLVKFFEINPAVVNLAKQYFTFIKDSSASVETIIGDGRLALEREESQAFDVILLDAFSGDSVPMHLLTKEAIAEYMKHLSPHGVLVFHITNFYIDLVPVVVAAGNTQGLVAFYVSAKGEKTKGQVSSKYLVLSKPESTAAVQGALLGAPQVQVAKEDQRLWTDDFSDLLRVVRW